MKSKDSSRRDYDSRACAQCKVSQLTSGASASGVAQFIVSASGTYKLSSTSLAEVKKLDGKIPAAENQAKNEVKGTGVSDSFTHSPTQTNYINNPSPMTWGYCVEEQLNKVAPSMGWSTQVVLTGSRPDYGKKKNGKLIFADLTTNSQAGFGGNHITQKLQVAESNGENSSKWEAADITHSSLNPLGSGGPKPIIKTNGKVTNKQMERFQKYYRYVNFSNDFDQGLENVKDKFNKVSHTTFTQKWGEKERKLFSSWMNKNGH